MRTQRMIQEINTACVKSPPTIHRLNENVVCTWNGLDNNNSQKKASRAIVQDLILYVESSLNFPYLLS